MTGFICHDDYYERLARLTDEELGHLFRALMLYHSGKEDEIPDFIGIEGLAFDFIKEDIDRAEESYREKRETNRLNGAKGGRPKAEENRTVFTETDVNRTVISETQLNPTKPYKDKDKEKDKDIKETPINGSKEKTTRFTPPTVEEVAAYCKERNNNVDAEMFVAFYASKGWKVGNTPMRDWKKCIITWEKREGVRASPKPAKTVVAQQYEQRDYSDDDTADLFAAEVERKIREKYG